MGGGGRRHLTGPSHFSPKDLKDFIIYLSLAPTPTVKGSMYLYLLRNYLFVLLLCKRIHQSWFKLPVSTRDEQEIRPCVALG